MIEQPGSPTFVQHAGFRQWYFNDVVFFYFLFKNGNPSGCRKSYDTATDIFTIKHNHAILLFDTEILSFHSLKSVLSTFLYLEGSMILVNNLEIYILTIMIMSNQNQSTNKE